MRPTPADLIAGLKLLKQAAHKTEHRASKYFHFSPQKIWTYDGEYGATMDFGLGFSGKVASQTIMDLIKHPDVFEMFLNSRQDSCLVDVEELDTDCPFPTDSQYSFVSDTTNGLADILKELFKTLEFSGWLTSSILLGKHALIAADGEHTFARQLSNDFSCPDAAVVPERFGRLLSRLGDPLEIRAKKYIKASYMRGTIGCHVFADSSSVVISQILSSLDNYNKFATAESAHILDGRMVQRACCKCDLSYQCKLKTNRMGGEGSPGAIMFVGKHPGKDDDVIGRPMTGPNGKLFWELLRDAGYQQGEVYITNCIKCSPITTNGGVRHWKACQSHFLEELERIKPKMIVAVGADATEYLTGRTGVLGLRGTGLSCVLDENYTVYPIRQPMALEHAQHADRDALKASMVSDLRDLRNILYTGGQATVDTIEDSTDYKIAETAEDVDAFLLELEQYDDLACDLETTGFEETEKDAAIVAIGFSKGPGHGRAIPLFAKGEHDIFWWSNQYLQDVLIPKIKDFILRKRVFGHNFIKFDCRWTRKFWGIDPPNIDFDTLLGSYAAFHGLRSYELEVLANSLCGMKKWKREFTLEDTRKLCIYLCKDVDATYRLRKEVDKSIDQLEIWLLQNILIPVARQLSIMEEHGVGIDLAQIDKVDELLKRKTVECLAEIRAIPEVSAWEIENGVDFNPDSPKQVGDIMFNKLRLRVLKRTASGAPSADREVMEQYEEENPFCGSVMRYKRLSKLRGTYVVGMRESIRDSVIHTTYKEHGTVTGRLASSNPNLQNIPREDTAGEVLDDGSDIKRMFIPRPGSCFLQADYSQIELRILSCMSGDPNMQAAFARGEDIHSATAAKVYAIPLEEVTKAQRNDAKRTNFGITYGMGLPALIKKFLAGGATEEAAKNFWDRHHEEFPLVWEFMAAQEKLVIRDGKQTTYFGRTRVYETKDSEAFRQAYNFPIQSMASDLTLLSIVRTGRALRELNIGAYPVLTVHDSIIYDVPVEHFWYVGAVVKSIMESMSFPWLVVPIKADLQGGPNWGKLFKVDLDKRQLVEDK